MKKLFAIVLLVVHLFNLGGYMLWHQYLLERSDRRMNDLISHNLYDPNSLVELKIKQHVRGIREWSDYQNVRGLVQLKNKCYNYVKLKLTRDTLFIMCVPNYEKTRLMDNNVIYANQINDIPLDKKGHESSVKKAGDNKYDHPQAENTLLTYNELQPVSIKSGRITIDNPLLAVPGQPPNLTA